MGEHHRHHDHSHSHSHSHSHRALNNISMAFFLNLFFTLIEIAGGFLTNSMAIITDAIHDLGDTLSLGISWYMEKYAHKKRDHIFSFGYRRFSLLAAFLSGIILLIGSLAMIVASVPRLLTPEPVHTDGMIGFAILGFLVNLGAAIRLQKGKTVHEQVITLHLLEDVLGWLAVLITAIAIKLGDWFFLDSLLSLALACFMLFNSAKRLKKSLYIFLQSIPDDINLSEIESQLKLLPGVADIHDTHMWTLDGEHHVLSTHIVTTQDLVATQAAELKIRVRKKLLELGAAHATIEIETQEEACEWQDCEGY